MNLSLLDRFPAMTGCSTDEFCNRLYKLKPMWASGTTISLPDAQFLFAITFQAGTREAVEIGTASGLSTVFLCKALEHAALCGNIPTDYKVISYDISSQFYADPKRRVGDAAREMLPAELLEKIQFVHPATACDAAKQHDQNELNLVFIDANHRHPWPALDLLALVDVLSPDGLVLFHDINLPLLHPEFQDWGAKYLFDDLDLEKITPPDGTAIPQIGGVRIPGDKEKFRQQLHQIIHAHKWEANVPADYCARLKVKQLTTP